MKKSKRAMRLRTTFFGSPDKVRGKCQPDSNGTRQDFLARRLPLHYDEGRRHKHVQGTCLLLPFQSASLITLTCRDGLRRVSIRLTCYGRDGNLVKRVTPGHHKCGLGWRLAGVSAKFKPELTGFCFLWGKNTNAALFLSGHFAIPVVTVEHTSCHDGFCQHPDHGNCDAVPDQAHPANS